MDIEKSNILHVSTFPEFCFRVQKVSEGLSAYVGLSSSGKLYVSKVGDSEGVSTLASNATSFTIASDFLIFTTSSHEANFIALSSLATDDTPKAEKRRVERGSRIVVAVPSSMSLVLQMPRGNLETINPRPMVMAVVGRDLDA